jgi:signal transduction histidine kinase
MLHEFVAVNRDAIIGRTSRRLSSRGSPPVSTGDLDNGVPMFLSQVSELLRLDVTRVPFAPMEISATAAQHGAKLRTLGFSMSQLIHGYGDICQVITELAMEQQVPITTEEFHILNRCLDIAIAEAVTEHARMTAAQTWKEETERLGNTAHELRDVLNTALLAFNTLKRGSGGIGGSTGVLLGRSLLGLGQVVDSALTEVRLATGKQWRERLQVLAFLQELATTGRLHAEYRAIEFTLEPVDPDLFIDADAQLMTSAVMNLVQNALKSTLAGGRVALRARQDDARVRIEIEDECGGLPPDAIDPFLPFGERRGRDRSGLGLGLSIARKAARAHGGDIHIRNVPNKGCVFVVDIPLAVEAPHDPALIA